MISFVVPAAPSGSGFAALYPANFLKAISTNSMNGRDPFTGAVALDFVATLQYPDGWSMEKRANTVFHPPGFFLGQIQAHLADALAGVVYGSPDQIAQAKWSTLYGPRPELRVKVSPLKQGLSS